MKTENKKPNNPNAFPSDLHLENGESQKGMTLRDYFANSAMQSIISTKLNDPNFNIGANNENNNMVSIVAYSIADAMLKQRELDNL